MRTPEVIRVYFVCPAILGSSPHFTLPVAGKPRLSTGMQPENMAIEPLGRSKEPPSRWWICRISSCGFSLENRAAQCPVPLVRWFRRVTPLCIIYIIWWWWWWWWWMVSDIQILMNFVWLNPKHYWWNPQFCWYRPIFDSCVCNFWTNLWLMVIYPIIHLYPIRAPNRSPTLMVAIIVWW